MRHTVRHMSPALLAECENSCSPPGVAGLTYAGVSALSLLGRLPRKAIPSTAGRTISAELIDDLIRWLISRQTLMLQEDEDFNLADEDCSDPTPQKVPPKFHVASAHPAGAETVSPSEPSSIEISKEEMRWVGINGRCNKVADTCYTFWVGGSLAVCLNPCPRLLYSAIYWANSATRC